MTVFAGSLEFALANLLVGAFSPLEAFFLAVVINARHVFYGISMLDKYKGLGKKKIYMIFALCDETFSVNYSAEPPRGVDRGWFMFYTSLLDQSYWVLGATLGGLFGSLIPADLRGIDFAMTAMFVVILLEQILAGKKNLPSVAIGLTLSLASLLIFGADGFIIPAMVMIFAALAVFRGGIERLGGDAK
jgi:4-azaleucine resistance transporter AzlC